jgi:ABC-type branched-subunit amino acid transport system permease subunit
MWFWRSRFRNFGHAPGALAWLTLQAIRDSEQAEFAGVPVRSAPKMVAFTIAGLYAGLAGAFCAVGVQ